jgi:hypothetical protein
MCKLCNTNRPDSQSRLFTRGTKYQEFVTIVLDYTGENPCNTCMSTYAASRNKSGKDIDHYIYIRLTKAYATRGNSKLNKRARYIMPKVYDIENFKKHSRKAVTKYNNRVMVREPVEKNIQLETNTSSQLKKYRVQITRNSVKHEIYFTTLKEAQEFKQRIINEHKRP